MRVIGLLVPAVLAAGCFSFHDRPPPRFAPGQEVRVRTRDGETLTVKAPLTPGGWRTTAGELIPRSEVASYELVNHGKGLERGAIYGLATGAVVGTVFGLAVGESCTGDEEFCIDRARVTPLAAVSLGLIGMILGGGIGGLAGYTDVYVNPEPQAARASF